MPLSPGTRLGSYEVISSLGSGGMGEVYRARDTRLGRDVAVKVLPAEFATSDDRLRRFEQEARATAALNHPNILTVFDVGRHGETAYVVGELLEGVTLRDRLADGALPVRIVVDYAGQIARGLTAAHDKGIVHRDLKPENVFITHDERVKILDFGLAKIAQTTSSASGTQLGGGTEPGMVLGTVGYMAPEQVRAQAVDHRADIFSFGTIVYEMLSGHRAFGGATTADTMTSILRETPADLTAGGRAIPAALERVVNRCLEKSPERRFQSATDLAFAIETLSDSRSSSGAEAAAAMPATRRAIHWAAALGVGLAGGAAFMWLGLSGGGAGSDTRSVAEVGRFRVSAADGIAVDDLTRTFISPDGRYLATTEETVAGRRLVVLSLVDGVRRDLGPAAPYAAIVWSPDSQSLAFSLVTALHTIRVDGTGLQRVAPMRRTPFGTWSPNGEIILIASSGEVVAIPAAGGEPRVVLKSEAGKTWDSVAAMPDGKRVLLARSQRDDSEIVLATLDGSRPPAVLGKGGAPTFIAPDRLLGVRGRQLVVWPMNPDSETPLGESAVVLADLVVRRGIGVLPYSASQTGTLALDVVNQTTRLSWFDRTGREGTALVLTQHCRNPELSPDYRRAAIDCYDASGNRDIWLYDFARDAAEKLTLDPADDADAVWTTDGKSLLFASSRQGADQVYRMSAAGGAAELIVPTDISTPPMALSPNGRDLLALSRLRLFRIELGVSAQLHPVTRTEFTELEAQFSPDGRYISLSSNQTDQSEVYVEPWPQTGERWKISTGGGTDARWSPTGREIVYVSPDRRLMSVSVQPTGALNPSRPVELFRSRIAGPLGLGHRFPYAISKDGQRFLMYVTVPDAAPASIPVIVNWPALVPPAGGRR